MRTVIYSMGVSLDCYIAGPDGNDWGAPDAELHRFHNHQTSELGLHVLGRRLYEVMAFWETADERDQSTAASLSELDVAQLEFARIWKQLPKLVFSKSLEAVEGNARLSRADPVQMVQALREEDGRPIAVGGADLAATLTAHQLIDEYHLFVYPVALGGGKPFSLTTLGSTSSSSRRARSATASSTSATAVRRSRRSGAGRPPAGELVLCVFFRFHDAVPRAFHDDDGFPCATQWMAGRHDP